MQHAYWLWPEGTVSPEMCDEWVKRYDELVETAVVDRDTVDFSIRRSKVCFVGEQDVLEVMSRSCLEANRKAFGLPIGNHMDCQFTKYDSAESDFYGWHMDSAIINPEHAYDRKLSCVVLLSDPNDFSGGQFEFFEHGQPPLGKGSIVVFPSVLYHRVTEVTGGVRYSMVSWMEGPQWR